MSKVGIFWDPDGFELDSLGTKQLLGISDGDTPSVSMSVRMLSIDTPEVHYPGNTSPARHDTKLAQLADWIQQGRAPVDPELGAYLHPKLASGRAGTLQKQLGEAARAAFQALLDARLTLPDGRRRNVMLRGSNAPFDQYGRLLAYVAPYYSAQELEGMSLIERATFNLQMIDTGWAVSFVIYPSLPKYADLVLLQSVAQAAVEQQKGAWAEPLYLTGYEFRMCYQLMEVTAMLVRGVRLDSRERSGWIDRYCVDMRTREIYPPQAYIKVPPYDRLFVWPKDVREAVGRLNLVPGG